MISIALATYNGAGHLQAQLDSLVGQNRRPDELVVSDDGSTDGSQDIVRRFAAGAPFPVRLLERPQRLGFADNFLTAAAACTKEMIAFCDQDDVWLPEKLELAEACLLRGQAALFIHQSRIVDENLNGAAELDQRMPQRGLVPPLKLDAYDLGYGHCMVFDRRLLEIGDLWRRPPQPRGAGQMAHDHWIMQMGALFGSIQISDRQLTLYRQHSANAFGSVATASNTLNDFASPAIADYAAERDCYRQLLDYLSDDVAEAGADLLGGHVTGACVRMELTLRTDRLQARIDTYTRSNVTGRAGALLAAVRDGLRSSSVTARELILTGGKDVLFGVIAQRRTKR